MTAAILAAGLGNGMRMAIKQQERQKQEQERQKQELRNRIVLEEIENPRMKRRIRKRRYKI